MKMRKLLSALLVVATVLGFTSCEDDEIFGIEFTFMAKDGFVSADTEVKLDSTVSIAYTILSEEKLENLTISVDGTVAKTIALNKKEETGTFTYTFNKAGAINVVFRAEDNAGKVETKNFTITVTEEAPVTTPLADAVAFKLGNPEGTDYPRQNDVVNLKWASNVDGNTAKFSGINGAMFVPVAADATVATKEDLAALYAAGTAAADFTAQSDANFVTASYITMVNEVYYLVKITALNFSEGANKAEFTYQM